MTRGSWPAGAALLLLVACGGPAAPWPAPPPVSLDLRAELSASSVPLLQPFELRLDLYRRADLAVEFDPKVDAKDFLCDVERLPEREFGDGRWQRTVLRLRAVRGPGELVLPPFTARATDGTLAASTGELKVTVGSLLTGAAAELEAPAPPFPPGFALPGWSWALLLLVALLTGFWFWQRRRTRNVVPADAVAVPPHTKALRALARLRSQPRTTPAQIDAFYVDLSAVLRVYLEERFQLHAPERTTEEFLQELDQGDQLARAHREPLRRFLRQCDLVKFAAQVPGPEEHDAVLAIAESVVQQTRADRTAIADEPPPLPVAEVRS